MVMTKEGIKVLKERNPSVDFDVVPVRLDPMIMAVFEENTSLYDLIPKYNPNPHIVPWIIKRKYGKYPEIKIDKWIFPKLDWNFKKVK